MCEKIMSVFGNSQHWLNLQLMGCNLLKNVAFLMFFPRLVYVIGSCITLFTPLLENLGSRQQGGLDLKIEAAGSKASSTCKSEQQAVRCPKFAN
jgi:hypothetical protein